MIAPTIEVISAYLLGGTVESLIAPAAGQANRERKGLFTSRQSPLVTPTPLVPCDSSLHAFRPAADTMWRSNRMKQKKAERLAKQRERSKRNRARRKACRSPDRDDIARVALWWLITSVAPMGQRKLDELQAKLIPELTRLGFDQWQSENVLAHLVDRYTEDGWDFQRKLHLIPRPN